MSKGRRVGTLTAGIMLVSFGVLFLIDTFFKNINYNFIMNFWPVVFILLGIEILRAYVVNKDEKINYDTGAIFLVIVISCFSMVMAWAEFMLKNHIVY